MASRKRARESSFLRVFDETRRLLNTATTVTLQPVRVTNPAYKASSKPGMFVEYLLDVPRGDYDLAIAARDYTPHRSRISVGAERTQTITVTLNRKGTPEEGNAVERAHAWFSDIRTFPAKRVAPQARDEKPSTRSGARFLLPARRRLGTGRNGPSSDRGISADV